MADQNPNVSEPVTEVVQITDEELQELLLRRSSTSSTAHSPPSASAVLSGMPGPSSSTRPQFSKPGLARQFEFNSSILATLTPIMEMAPEEFDIKSSLRRAITSLTQRNELLTVADSNPERKNHQLPDRSCGRHGCTTRTCRRGCPFGTEGRPGSPSLKGISPSPPSHTVQPREGRHVVKVLRSKDTPGVLGQTATTVAASAILLTTAKRIPSSESELVAGRIHQKAQFWLSLHLSPFLRDTILFGYSPFLMLPFGLSSAPMIFTKLMRPLLAKWRSHGHKIAVYLDDGLIWSNTAHRCEESIEVVKKDLEDAGFVVAEEKSTWVPVQKIIWLGHEIDLNNFV
ncbi:hypothetical protein OESDEN_21686, partial [Oesophagostomum dentatum]